MANDWVDKSPDVTGSTSILIPNYGYIYKFDCLFEGRFFNQMSKIFVKSEFDSDPKTIYQYFRKRNAITSLRGKERTEEKAIDEAKEFEDYRREKEVKKIPVKNKEKSPSSEQISEFLKRKREECKQTGEWTPEKDAFSNSNNWYIKAKTSYKTIIN